MLFYCFTPCFRVLVSVLFFNLTTLLNIFVCLLFVFLDFATLLIFILWLGFAQKLIILGFVNLGPWPSEMELVRLLMLLRLTLLEKYFVFAIVQCLELCSLYSMTCFDTVCASFNRVYEANSASSAMLPSRYRRKNRHFSITDQQPSAPVKATTNVENQYSDLMNDMWKAW